MTSGPAGVAAGEPPAGRSGDGRAHRRTRGRTDGHPGPDRAAPPAPPLPPAPLAIVPAPLHLEVRTGPPFVLAAGTQVVAGDSAEEISAAVLTAELIGAALDIPLGLGTGAGGEPGTIAVLLDADAGPLDRDPAERYTLGVTARCVEIRAPHPEGLLRGAATLRQLLTVHGDEVTFPAVMIHDAPRYPWRGLCLDAVRHFPSVDAVRAVVCAMAHLKLNVLHLQLADDRGRRLDLPSRPPHAGGSSAAGVDGGPGGHYSAGDWDGILTYAAARHVVVVPEVDVLRPVDGAPDAGVGAGPGRLPPDVPATEDHLRDVLGELAAMTPGPFLHVGGHGVPAMPGEEGAWFVRTAQDVVRAAGKGVVAWQGLAHGDVDPGTVLQVRDPGTDPAPVVAAADRGARVLLSPGDRVRLDLSDDDATDLGPDRTGHVELRDAYAWEPDDVVPGLPPAAVVGVEAAVWAETLRTTDDLFVVLLPRLAAVAEVAWSAPDRRDWAGFRRRVAGLADGWDRDGFLWYPSPQVDW